MRVLVACEESQAVTIEFRKLGHEAYSCDLQECSGGHPEWHFQEDVFGVIDYAGPWDMMIAFPPCTYLCYAGLHWCKKRPERTLLRDQAFAFAMELFNSPIKKIALENPQGYIQNAFRKPNQIIHPFYFGDNDLKRTCLWLKNLPRLQGLHEVAMNIKKHTPQPTKWIVRKNGYKAGQRKGIYFMDKVGMPTKEKAKLRSKTFPGIARAMAEQWGRT